MIVSREEKPEGPNEVIVYVTPEQLAMARKAMTDGEGVHDIQRISERAQKFWCRRFLEMTEQAIPARTVLNLCGVHMDSKELGQEVVQRMLPVDDLDVFDPDYHPVSLSIRLLDAAGVQVLNELDANPQGDTEKLDSALDAARQLVYFNLQPSSPA